LRELLLWVALSWQGAFPTDPAFDDTLRLRVARRSENRKGYRLR
jgi:hypothetical protein